MNREPWPDKYIEAVAPSRAVLDHLEAVLGDAREESPLQHALVASPFIWRALLPSCADVWAFDRPPLGGRFVPDFLLCQRDSTGFNWTLVELESPTSRPLTRAGTMSAKLNRAQTQIRDWRSWLRQNISYANEELGFRGIHAECPAWIVIGRRHMIGRDAARRYRELSAGRDEVMTYDRLMEAAHESSQNRGKHLGQP
jgi:hypothetical protein